MSQSFDVTVIGSGPGGVAAALEAAQLGLSTCLIEKDRLGGTCLQVGCIPSKTFLHAAALLDDLKTAKNFGIETGTVSLNPASLIQKKQNVIAILEKGIKTSLEKAKVTVTKGEARFTGPKEITAAGEKISSKYFILATGSRPRALSQFPFDGKQIISSTEGLESRNIPKSLVIIGGGVIGVEFASMYSSFGSKVTVVEMLDRLIATEDPEISKRMEVSLKKRGAGIFLNDVVISSERKDGFRLKLKSGPEINADQILVAIGRSRNTEGLNLEAAGVRVLENGAVEVNEYLETSQPGIYAIGDLIQAPQLAHAASYEGVVAAKNLHKENRIPVDLNLIPNAIYTHPEAASVGLTVEKAQNEGIASAKEVKMLFGAVGRSHTEGSEEGIAKLVYDGATGKLLGAHLFGPHVTELISEMTLAIKAKLTLKDLSEIIHPHPTLAEIFQELSKTNKTEVLK